MVHKYPQDLVVQLLEKWHRPMGTRDPNDAGPLPLPSNKVLEELLSTCYQVSQMQEESRDIRFRLILAEAEHFRSKEGEQQGLFILKLIPMNCSSLFLQLISTTLWLVYVSERMKGCRYGV